MRRLFTEKFSEKLCSFLSGRRENQLESGGKGLLSCSGERVGSEAPRGRDLQIVSYSSFCPIACVTVRRLRPVQLPRSLNSASAAFWRQAISPRDISSPSISRSCYAIVSALEWRFPFCSLVFWKVWNIRTMLKRIPPAAFTERPTGRDPVPELEEKTLAPASGRCCGFQQENNTSGERPGNCSPFQTDKKLMSPV